MRESKGKEPLVSNDSPGVVEWEAWAIRIESYDRFFDACPMMRDRTGCDPGLHPVCATRGTRSLVVVRQSLCKSRVLWLWDRGYVVGPGARIAPLVPPHAGTGRFLYVAVQVTDRTPAVIQAERKRRSTFILLTSKITLDAKVALPAYTGQAQNEHRIRWIKSPICLGAF